MAVVERRFRVMASDSSVVVVDGNADHVAVARTRLDRLEALWSRFIATSDITRINMAEGRHVMVDPDTITLIATMKEAERVTGGRYDPTILPVLVANGYGHSIDDPSRVTLVPAGPTTGRLRDVEIDVACSAVTAPPGVVLDPGGIGKGLAADLTVAHLVAQGARRVLVNIGGDMAMSGEPPQPDGWYVTVEWTDRADGAVCTLAVSAGGVATSSTRSRTWDTAGGHRHHLIDPARARQSDTDLAAVTVVARSGWLAEAHATAALLEGSDGVLAYLDRHELTGIAITTTGFVIATDDVRAGEHGPGSRAP